MNTEQIEVIHYGADRYDPAMFSPVVDDPYRIKPFGGLWTSPIDSAWGWKDWAQENEFGDLSKHFKLVFYGRVFRINSYKDMLKLPWVERQGKQYISFQDLCEGYRYDAIHLTEKGERDTRFTYPKSLYGWDCETLLILNPNSILE